MTSELRPALEVATDCYEQEFFGIEAAAAVIEADREAVRAEQAAEIADLSIALDDATDIIRQATDDIKTQAAELAKFKALAETLAGALGKIAPIRVHNGPDYAEVYFADGKTHATQAMTMNPQDWIDLSEALSQYKEARDES